MYTFDAEHPAKILVLHYSQTGQLSRVLQSIIAPLKASSSVALDCVNLEPVEPYPFPWPFVDFINAFPESAHEVGCELKPLPIDPETRYDLVILGYQVWFLAPSIPVTGFFKSPIAEQLLADTPVVTVVACRNMWLMAQEKVKRQLARLNAKLIGHVALVDEAGTAASFFSTPLWVLTGKKGPFPLGIPAAGVSEADIGAASRFGEAIRQRVEAGLPLDSTLWQGLGAVRVNANLIASEKVATRSFYLWGKLFRCLGGPRSFLRKPLVFVYAAFLLTLILTVVPITALVKKLLAPLMASRIQQQKHYFSAPSGEERA